MLRAEPDSLTLLCRVVAFFCQCICNWIFAFATFTRGREKKPGTLAKLNFISYMYESLDCFCASLGAEMQMRMQMQMFVLLFVRDVSR